ncbi:hypothetical protein ACOMHN_020182 [Nucella lapillus]
MNPGANHLTLSSTSHPDHPPPPPAPATPLHSPYPAGKVNVLGSDGDIFLCIMMRQPRDLAIPVTHRKTPRQRRPRFLSPCVSGGNALCGRCQFHV